MDPTTHPGLRFQIGDIVIPVRRPHPVFLRPDPDGWTADWKTCPSWTGSVPGIVVDVKVDMCSIGEVMLKIITPSGSGWTDWWNVSQSDSTP